MTADLDKLRKQDNARLFISLAVLLVVLAVALGVSARRFQALQKDIKTNRVGVACLMKMNINPHRPPSRACARFMKENT